MAIKEGETVLYTKTGTVGKVTKVLTIDNKLWAELDSTGLLYDENVLEPAPADAIKKRSGDYAEGKEERAGPRECKDIEKEMKDEGTLDSSAGICGAG